MIISLVSSSQTVSSPASGVGGTSTVASSQPSLSPGIVGVSTQAVFLILPSTYFVILAFIVKLFDSPTFRLEIVVVHVPLSILPSLAETNVTPVGCLSVTTASLSSTFPVLVTLI